MTRMRGGRPPREPWTNEPADAVEMLGQLVGRTTYITPRSGGARGNVADARLTGALGLMPDQLEALLLMSVGGRHGKLEGEILRLAYPRVLRAIERGPVRGFRLATDADRFRVRIVLQEALRALIWPEQRIGVGMAAKTAKMRTEAYAALYRFVEAWLAAKFADGRREFKVRLWADDIRRERAAVAPVPPGNYGVLLLDTTDDSYVQLGYFAGASPGVIARDLAHVPELVAAVASVAPDPHRRRVTVHVAVGTRTVSAVIDRW